MPRTTLSQGSNNSNLMEFWNVVSHYLKSKYCFNTSIFLCTWSEILNAFENLTETALKWHALKAGRTRLSFVNHKAAPSKEFSGLMENLLEKSPVFCIHSHLLSIYSKLQIFVGDIPPKDRDLNHGVHYMDVNNKQKMESPIHQSFVE